MAERDDAEPGDELSELRDELSDLRDDLKRPLGAPDLPLEQVDREQVDLAAHLRARKLRFLPERHFSRLLEQIVHSSDAQGHTRPLF